MYIILTNNYLHQQLLAPKSLPQESESQIDAFLTQLNVHQRFVPL